MARRGRPEADDDDAETPPWMERAPVSRRAAEPAGTPTQTFVSWRALIIGAVVALLVAVGLVIGVRRMSTPDRPGVAAGGEVPIIRAPATPYRTRAGGADATDLAAAGPDSGGADATAVLDAPPEQAAPERPGAKPTDLLAGTDGVVDATADEPGVETPLPAAVVPRRVPPVVHPLPPITRPDPDAATTVRAKPGTAELYERAPTAKRAKAVLADEPVPARGPRKAEAAPSAPVTAKLDERAVEEAVRGGGGASVQLGAFSSREKALAAWEAAGAGGGLAGLHRQVETIVREGKTLYRLRATGVGARGGAVCDAVKATGAACVAVK